MDERDARLLALDVAWFQQLWVGSFLEGAATDGILIQLHAARYHHKGLPEKERKDSKKWLKDNGHDTKMGGVLPGEELP